MPSTISSSIFNSKLSERPERYKTGGSSYIHFLRVIFIERLYLYIILRYRICLIIVLLEFKDHLVFLIFLILVYKGIKYKIYRTHVRMLKWTIPHISNISCKYYNIWQVKDIESKLRQRNTLHSISPQKGTVEAIKYRSPSIPQTLTRTKSSGSVNQQLSAKNSSNTLLKSKSSTYISPDQNESLMYNTKVTLQLRRSNSNVNTCHKNGFSNELKEIGHQNGNGNSNGLSRCHYYFGDNPIASHQTPTDIFAGAHQLPRPPLPPASSKPILQRTVNIFLSLFLAINGLITTQGCNNLLTNIIPLLNAEH